MTYIFTHRQIGCCSRLNTAGCYRGGGRDEQLHDAGFVWLAWLTDTTSGRQAGSGPTPPG